MGEAGNQNESLWPSDGLQTASLLFASAQLRARAQRPSSGLAPSGQAVEERRQIGDRVDDVVGVRLRKSAGKRDHRKIMSDDGYLVLRPGPNFDWLMGNPAPAKTSPPGQNPTGDDRHDPGEHAKRLP